MSGSTSTTPRPNLAIATDFHSTILQSADQAEESEAIKQDRRFLQQGCSVQFNNAPHYLWLDEDLLHLRWCPGSAIQLKQSEQNDTHIKVENIGAVKLTTSTQFSIKLLINNLQVILFNVSETAVNERFVDCLTQLCQGTLAYKLLWDHRDESTEISVYWMAEQHYFEGTITGFDETTQQHKIKFTDNKERLYNLSGVFFRIERLPNLRRDGMLYNIEETKDPYTVRRKVRRSSIVEAPPPPAHTPGISKQSTASKYDLEGDDSDDDDDDDDEDDGGSTKQTNASSTPAHTYDLEEDDDDDDDEDDEGENAKQQEVKDDLHRHLLEHQYQVSGLKSEIQRLQDLLANQNQELETTYKATIEDLEQDKLQMYNRLETSENDKLQMHNSLETSQENVKQLQSAISAAEGAHVAAEKAAVKAAKQAAEELRSTSEAAATKKTKEMEKTAAESQEREKAAIAKLRQAETDVKKLQHAMNTAQGAQTAAEEKGSSALQLQKQKHVADLETVTLLLQEAEEKLKLAEQDAVKKKGSEQKAMVMQQKTKAKSEKGAARTKSNTVESTGGTSGGFWKACCFLLLAVVLIGGYMWNKQHQNDALVGQHQNTRALASCQSKMKSELFTLQEQCNANMIQEKTTATKAATKATNAINRLEQSNQHEKDQLYTKVKSLNTQIKSLTTKMTSLQKKHQVEMNSAQTETTTLDNSALALKKQIKSLTTELNALKKQLKTDVARLKEQLVSTHTEELHVVASKIKSCQAEKNVLQEKHDGTVSSSGAGLKKMKLKHVKELNALEATLKQMKIDHGKELAALNKKQENDLLALATKLNKAKKSEMKDLNSKVNTFDSTLAALKKKQEQELAALATKLNKAKKSEMKDLNSKVNTFDSTLAALKKTQEQELAALATKLNNAKKSEMKDLQNQMNTFDSTLAALKKNHKQELAALATKLNTANKKEVSGLEAKVKTFDGTLAALKTTKQKELKNLEIEAKTIRSDCARTTKAAAGELNKKIKQLESSIQLSATKEGNNLQNYQIEIANIKHQHVDELKKIDDQLALCKTNSNLSEADLLSSHNCIPGTLLVVLFWFVF